jgi:hypothetical protein
VILQWLLACLSVPQKIHGEVLLLLDVVGGNWEIEHGKTKVNKKTVWTVCYLQAPRLAVKAYLECTRCMVRHWLGSKDTKKQMSARKQDAAKISCQIYLPALGYVLLESRQRSIEMH